MLSTGANSLFAVPSKFISRFNNGINRRGLLSHDFSLQLKGVFNNHSLWALTFTHSLSSIRIVYFSLSQLFHYKN
jgi:hypothetical protein